MFDIIPTMRPKNNTEKKINKILNQNNKIKKKKDTIIALNKVENFVIYVHLLKL